MNEDVARCFRMRKKRIGGHLKIAHGWEPMGEQNISIYISYLILGTYLIGEPLQLLIES